MFSAHEKGNELREIYTNCLSDSETSNCLKAKILLQELKTYPFYGKSRGGRYLFDSEQESIFIYELAKDKLVNLVNKGFDKNYFVSITQKGEEELKKGFQKNY